MELLLTSSAGHEVLTGRDGGGQGGAGHLLEQQQVQVHLLNVRHHNFLQLSDSLGGVLGVLEGPPGVASRPPLAAE